MRAKVQQIVWHGKEPVYSLDFHPDGTLATGGGDKEIKLWRVNREADGAPTVAHMGSLIGGHSRTVNCVRFSPTGEHLASAGDGGEMFLWRANTQQLNGEETHWQRSILRSHTDDVQDLEWAPDGTALASGSIDNMAVLWDAGSARGVLRLEGHRHFVQGCAWDPASKLLATQSADRTCRIYGPKPPVAGKRGRPAATAGTCAGSARDLVCQHVLAKGRPAAAPGGNDSGGKAQRPALFGDEHMHTFFRRLAWSPDGSFLAVPTGTYQRGNSSPPGYTTYIYARGRWDAPVCHLPVLASPAVAITFCPRLFALRPPVPGDAAVAAPQPVQQLSPQVDGAKPEGAQPLVQLPYRMVFAVATAESVFLYDTQGMAAVGVVGALHMDVITDVAWSCDGATLAVASRDGYCSLTAFGAGELGAPPPEGAVPPHIAGRIAVAAKAVAPRPPPQPKQAAAAKPQPAARSPTPQQNSPAASPAGDAAAPLATPAAAQPSQAQPQPQQRRISPHAMQPAAGAAAGAPRRIAPQPVQAAAPGGASQQRRIQPQPVQPQRTAGAGEPPQRPCAPVAAVATADAGAPGTGKAGSGGGVGSLKREGPSAATAAESGGEQQASKKPRRLTPVRMSPAVPLTDSGPVGSGGAQPAASSDVSQPAQSSREAPPMPKHAPSRRITPKLVAQQQQAQQLQGQQDCAVGLIKLD